MSACLIRGELSEDAVHVSVATNDSRRVITCSFSTMLSMAERSCKKARNLPRAHLMAEEPSHMEVEVYHTNFMTHNSGICLMLRCLYRSIDTLVWIFCAS